MVNFGVFKEFCNALFDKASIKWSVWGF